MDFATVWVIGGAILGIIAHLIETDITSHNSNQPAGLAVWLFVGAFLAPIAAFAVVWMLVRKDNSI